MPTRRRAHAPTAVLIGLALAAPAGAQSPARPTNVVADAARAAIAADTAFADARAAGADAVALAWHPAAGAALALSSARLWADSTNGLLTARATPYAAPRADSTRRPRAAEYGDAYPTRLTLHRVGSFAMLPLFAAEYLLGDRLTDGGSAPAGWVEPTHVSVAVGLGALFASNTVTGVWNLWDSRRDPAGRARRIIHGALLLAADAGFAYTGTLGDDATHSLDGRRRHRAAALTSIGIGTVGTAMMWLWKN
jgi:hypothetical protein